MENTDGGEIGVVRAVSPSISACRSDVQSKMSIKFTRVDFCGVVEGGALDVRAVGSHVGNRTVLVRLANEKPLKGVICCTDGGCRKGGRVSEGVREVSKGNPGGLH